MYNYEPNMEPSENVTTQPVEHGAAERDVSTKTKVLWLTTLGILIVALAVSLVFILRRRVVGAVVSNGLRCADIGRQMLGKNGTAVDAAIATLLCEGVHMPHCLGIGGGFAAIIYIKSEKKIETLVARESAPTAAHKDMYVGQKPMPGPRMTAVPGEIMGYWEMHQRHGRLPWHELFQPTIDVCRKGHRVSKHLAVALAASEQNILKEPTMREIFIKPDGKVYKKGDYIKRLALADTLERIAENGFQEFYNGGRTGKMFAADVEKMGGIVTEEDLKNYKVAWQEDDHAMANITGGHKLYTTPLPTSGAVLAFILNVMNDLFVEDIAIYYQRLVETYKHAFGQRSHLGDMLNDPEMHATIESALKNLQSEEFANHIRNSIQDDTTFTDLSIYGAKFALKNDHGTANIAVLTSNGDAVIVTSSLNNYFGAMARSSHTGIILNDQMQDFSTPGVVNFFGIPASPSNYIKPGKRPMSSICPSIILDEDGNVRLLVGAAGGTKIITSVAGAIVKYLVWNETLQDAVNGYRLHHQLTPMYVDTEYNFPAFIRDYLTEVGHNVVVSPQGAGFAALTAIGVRNGVAKPVYDRRRGGSTATIHG